MINFKNQVAIVTGAGNGLGRSHALLLAQRGAKVVVNDLGGSVNGEGAGSQAAQAVVAEIEAMGGEAIASGANVADFEAVNAMVAQTMEKWGRVDVLINNAGILRDKSFSKMEMSDFKLVMDVHVMGAVHCCKAVWEIMKAQNYGRILLTSSSSGLYGNFGQSNYGTAKAAMVGLMNVLHLEGAKNNIRINTLAPTAATRMTENLIPPDVLKVMTPESISPGVVYLVSENAPSKVILGAGAGTFAQTHIYETDGINLKGEDLTPEMVEKHFAEISDASKQKHLNGAFEQTNKFVEKAMQG